MLWVSLSKIYILALKILHIVNPNVTSMIHDNPKAPSVDDEATTVKASKMEEEQSEPSDSQDKTLKKPEEHGTMRNVSVGAGHHKKKQGR